MATGLFLREKKFAVGGHLEDTTPRGGDDELRYVVLELFEDPLRQTDGSR